MRFLLINHIQNARQSLKSSRVRSCLTMLGTAIGVASVTAILALGNGASGIISNQIDSAGGNIVIVKPGNSINAMANIASQAQPNHNFITSSLTEKDIESILTIKDVSQVAPIMLLSGSIIGESSNSDSADIVATSQSLAEISNLKMSHGQFLDGSTNRSTAVLGTTLSRKMFSTDNSIGRQITIRGKVFTVVGVMSEIDEVLNFNSIDYNNSAFITFNDGKIINNSSIQIQQIDIKTTSVADLANISTEIQKTISKNHDGENDFEVLFGNEISKSTSEIFYLVIGVTTAIAAISIIVGGIGIMNIMLVTVAERTREIGIRKALGATNSDIIWQFLIESAMLGIGGGAVGYLGGYALAFVICRLYFTFLPTFNGDIAAIALILSVMIGVFSGLYPAFKASRKNPIQSLQNYN